VVTEIKKIKLIFEDKYLSNKDIIERIKKLNDIERRDAEVYEIENRNKF
jgi:hypothetical protein